jgi:GNAT superfamily N-acetyltransferase
MSGEPNWNANHDGSPQSRRSGRTAIEVIPVVSGADRKAFAEFPWVVNQNDPQWVPPLISETLRTIDPRKHPFYQHGAAVPFVARRGGKMVGRILASDDPNFNAQQGTRIGCFSMFECVDDERVAHALFEQAAAWLRSRGLERIRGPIEYSMNYPCGLLIDGFDTPPRVMMNHNPRYYEGLIESWGFAKAKDLYAWWFTDPHKMLDSWRDIAQRIQQRTQVTIRPVRMNRLEEEMEYCKEVYNATWEEHWGFVKMTDAEFRWMAEQLKRIGDPNLVLLAEQQGKPIGVCITLPDINEAIRHANGRLFTWGLPIGLAKAWYYSRKIQTVRMAVLGTLKEYRRRGIAELLMLETLSRGRSAGHYTGAELSWTLEDNDLINRAIERTGGVRYKTYRVFERGVG